MSRATAVQALIDKIRGAAADSRANASTPCQTDETWHADEYEGWADELAALLLREGPPQESQLSPTTECPDGEKHVLRCIRCELPATGLPDHCENCRVEMPVTTVHLCHACLPSAPREDAGEALATEPGHEAPLEVVRQVIASLRDVVSVGRFAVAVDPARFCNDLASHLESAVAKLAASQAGAAPRDTDVAQMTNLQRQVLCVMVADHGYDHQPPNGWAPIRHQFLWMDAVEGVHTDVVTAEVERIKATMIRNGETFVDYLERKDPQADQ